MPTRTSISARTRLLAFLLAIGVSLGVGFAHVRLALAGQYAVTTPCQTWTPYGDQVHIALATPCPGLLMQTGVGAFTTGAGVAGGWRFDAPAGTSIDSVTLGGWLLGHSSWQATAFTEGLDARTLEDCPGSQCPGGQKNFGGLYPVFNAGAINLRVRCGASSCANTGVDGQIQITDATVVLNDPSPPSVSVVGGSLPTGGWTSGIRSVLVAASDNSGIQQASAFIDGTRVRTANLGCSFGLKVPCSNGTTELDVNTAQLADGAHSLQAQAVDASGNVGGSGTSTVYVDNQAPSQPLGAALEGPAGYRATNQFAISWTNPPQPFAPIVAADYTLCPTIDPNADTAARAAAAAQCVTGTRNGSDLQRIDDLSVPSPGAWTLKLWTVDAASNADPSTAATISGLDFDDSPPAAVTFLAPDPSDPARVNVQSSDPTSGIVSGTIEIRRDGQDSWQPLATQVTPGGLTAFMDDSVLPKGLYFMRATVTDGAGLEASDDREASGNPATLKLPVRLASTLAGGRKGRRVCHGHGHARSCANTLVTHPLVHVGRSTRLYGRLTVGGQPVPGTPVQVWRRLDLTGAGWVQLSTVTTSKTGRFSYLARRGPARSIRFSYAGTDTVRGRTRDMALRVPAAATLRPDHRSVINGEYVIFRGRLEGGWIPPAGALVELQVRERGEWRTFAQPRASAKTGRYAYRYKFETVRGNASFRFRARVRRQQGLPFLTGSSRAVRVKVHGL